MSQYVVDREYKKKKVITCTKCGEDRMITMESVEPLEYYCRECDNVFEIDEEEYTYYGDGQDEGWEDVEEDMY